MVGLYAEMIVDNDGVAGNRECALVDGGGIGFKTLVVAVQSEGGGETLDDGGRNDGIACEKYLCGGNAGAGMFGGVVPDAQGC